MGGHMGKNEDMIRKKLVYFEYDSVEGKKRRLKIPKDWADEVYRYKLDPRKDQDEINSLILDRINSSENYGKIVSQGIGRFLSDYHADRRLWEGGYLIFDEMKIGNLVIMVVGDTSRERPVTNMFAFREK